MNEKNYTNLEYELDDEIEYIKKYMQAFSNPKFYEYFSPLIDAQSGPKFSLQQCMGIYNAYVHYSLQIPEIMMRFWLPKPATK